DGHACPPERVAEHERGRERRVARDAAAVDGVVDRERGERRRLVHVVPGLPAGSCAPGVEERLVAEDRAGYAGDPGSPHLARERREVSRREQRVAVPYEQQAPPPGRALELPAADDVRLDPELRPEGDQSGVGDRELLVRGGREREPVVRGKNGSAG